ncbi:MAG: ribonuclease R family protein [Prochlorotrichaceae cyanobacterium]
MKFSIAALLANFTEDKLVAPKALEKKLGCEDEAGAEKLQIALDAMERLGILVKDRGKYRKEGDLSYVEGRLRCSSKGFCFAIQDDEDAEDVYIRECHLHHAWNGDRVLAKVTKEGSRRRSPEGEVLLILERANTSVLARVKQTEEQEFRAVPLDDRLLFELELEGNETDLSPAIDHLVNVSVRRYPIAQKPPLGHVTQVLGSTAEAASDIDIVRCKHSLPTDFNPEVLAAAENLPGRLRKTDQKNRVDLRAERVITIHVAHPRVEAEAESIIDNALSLTQSKEGDWKLGIHTADVAYYVPPESELDLEARRRGTTAYLGTTIIPLFPPSVVHDLCCLKPAEERLTVSLLVTLSPEGEVKEFELQPSMLQVDQALTYRQAQSLLDRDRESPLPEELEPFTDVVEILDHLMLLSDRLRQHRRQRGAFELNLPEHLSSDSNPAVSQIGSEWFSRFSYNDEGSLGAMLVAQELPIRAALGEVMILANHLVAQHLSALSLPAIYRIHRPPEPIQAQELLKLVENLGIYLEIDSEDGVQSKDYQRLLEEFTQSSAERVLTYLLQETLRPAAYATAPGKHFGLAIDDAYTHFTCPSRRYTDLVLQRILHTLFDQGRDRRSVRSKESVNLRHSTCHDQVNWNVLPPEIHSELEEQVAGLVIHLSEREKLVLEAEEDLIGLKKAEFMKAHTGGIFHGLITGVQSYGFFVEIEDLLVEGLVHVSSLKDDWYEYRSRQQCLVGRKNRQQYRLGDRVEVEVKNVDYYRQQIDLGVVSGGSTGGPLDDREETETEDYNFNSDRSYRSFP